MNATPPQSQAWKAIGVYLDVAYGQSLPLAVKSRVDALGNLDGPAFFESGMWEHEADRGLARFCLRLGNRHYPHMKMVIEPAPGGHGYVYRAECHDRHCCPPSDSPEYTEFLDLMDKNRVLAQSIEAAWSRSGVPTFQGLLREGADRRKNQSVLNTCSTATSDGLDDNSVDSSTSLAPGPHTRLS